MGKTDLELASGEVDHGDGIACGAVAAGASFGALDEGAEAFEPRACSKRGIGSLAVSG
jgi:hypothetical protein